MIISFHDVHKFLLIGGRVEGIRFGAAPQLLIANSEHNVLELRGQIYINLSSRWCLYAGKPIEFPKFEEEIPELNELEELLIIIELRNKIISNAFILEETSGLVLEFDDGSIFYMHGNNDQFESWDVGVSLIDEHWKVISMPEGEIVGMIPNKYKKKFASNS